MNVNFGELVISAKAKGHVLDCLATNQVSAGPKVKLFEEKWARLFGYPYTVAVNSGTSADIAACLALYDYGAKPGDYVICPALSFIATANAIRAAGFTPLFVDVKKETLNIDETLIEKTIKDFNSLNKYEDNQIIAIMAVNLMGKPAELDVIGDIAYKYKLKFIIDNCEAYGSTHQGLYALDYADFETTSHYIAHIVCGCELGTVSVKTKMDRDIILSVRSHGREPNSLYFNHDRFGLNLKPSDLHASIALGEVDEFWEIYNKRKANLGKFREAVRGYSHKVYLIQQDDRSRTAPHGFSLTLKEEYANARNKRLLTELFDRAGIQVKRNFGAMPDHGAFDYLGQKGRFPNASYIGEFGVHIGCHYWMTDLQVEHVCATLSLLVRQL